MSLLERAYNLTVLGRLRAAGPYDPGRVRKILVVRNDNIGDVLCTTPALDALRAAFPDAYIAALVCTLTTEAFEGHRALDRVWSYPKAKHKHYGPLESWTRMARVLGEIRRERFDLAVAFRSCFSSSQAWLAYASRARWRLGPEARGRLARWGFYYNLPAPWPPEGIHEVRRCFHLLGRLRLDSEPQKLYLEVPVAARERVEGFFRGAGLAPGGPVVVNITRWAYRPDRAWPQERYRELVRELAGREGGVLVTHAPADREWVTGLLKGLDAPTYSSKSLKDFAAAIGLGRLFVTAEGGPMHLAAAVGTPLVVLWGKTPLAVWRPWGADCRVLGARGPVADIPLAEVLAAATAAQPAHPVTPSPDFTEGLHAV